MQEGATLLARWLARCPSVVFLKPHERYPGWAGFNFIWRGVGGIPPHANQIKAPTLKGDQASHCRCKWCSQYRTLSRTSVRLPKLHVGCPPVEFGEKMAGSKPARRGEHPNSQGRILLPGKRGTALPRPTSADSAKRSGGGGRGVVHALFRKEQRDYSYPTRHSMRRGGGYQSPTHKRRTGAGGPPRTPGPARACGRRT